MNVIADVRAEALLARLAGAEDRLRAGLRRAVERRSIMLQAAVKGDKLSGQVLHVRTGTLRRSINRVVRDMPGEISATVGTNVRYAAVHEYGFDGIVSVGAHLRRSALQMAAKRSTKPGRGRVGKREGEIAVRAHTRHMRLPARSFLRSALAEQSDAIVRDLRAAALGALQL